MRGFASNATMAQACHTGCREPMNRRFEHDRDLDRWERCRSELELARAHVPFQQMRELFSPGEGLFKGTIFPELYGPYF